MLRSRRRLAKKAGKIDKTLLTLTVFFALLGIVTVADASVSQSLAMFSDPFYFAKQQAVWALLGFFALIAASFVPYSFWKRLAIPLFVVNLILLVLVLLPSVSTPVLGARRWIELGFFTIQPSELSKLTLIMLLATLQERKKGVTIFLGLLVLVAGLIMLEPDLGTTIIISVIALSQMFVSGVSIILLSAFILLGTVFGYLLIITSAYRKERLSTFLNLNADPLGASYHARQILIALGSGGLLGVGIGQSRQKHLFLPETATDSVFAVIAEELGFLGSVLIIVLFLFLIYKIIKLAKRSPDNFSSVLAVGVAAWIGWQLFLNLSSMVVLTPLTGIPLPFLSYGGSSLTTLMFSVGILLNISKHAQS